LKAQIGRGRCYSLQSGARIGRAPGLFALGTVVLIGCPDLALAKDLDDTTPNAASAVPNLYLDLRTSYSTVPANSLSIGFSSPSLSQAFATLQQLAPAVGAPSLPALPTLSSPSSRSVGVDVPLTVDLNDRISVYGGFSASTSQSGASDWSTLAITSWNVGFQADLYQQNGGSIPTITLQTTMTRSVPDSPLATTSLNNLVEFDYALNEDETKGLLAGVQYTKVAVDSPLARIKDNVIGYVGAYYQWPSNWKLSGRVGVQSFGGAQLLALTPIQPFIQPIVRVDLDRNDDNDNRLFGVSAQIAWTPKPAYQLTVRTPLYAVRN
jgi:hypothetical protein